MEDETNSEAFEQCSTKSETNETNQSAVVQNKAERKAFVPSNSLTKPIVTESDRKIVESTGIVIKKDYLPSPTKKIKVEKTRDDVARVLKYDSEPSNRSLAALNPVENETETKNIEMKIKTEPSDEPPKAVIDSPSTDSISEDKENAITQKHELETKPAKEKSDAILNHGLSQEISAKKYSENSGEKKSGSGSHQNHHRHHDAG